jgi:hypothetical protein
MNYDDSHNFDLHEQPNNTVANGGRKLALAALSAVAVVNILVRPGTHSYALLVRRAGHFEWYCMQPCDPFSMSHLGYMRGYITAI